MILIAESPSRRTEYRRYLGNAGLSFSKSDRKVFALMNRPTETRTWYFMGWAPDKIAGILGRWCFFHPHLSFALQDACNGTRWIASFFAFSNRYSLQGDAIIILAFWGATIVSDTVKRKT